MVIPLVLAISDPSICMRKEDFEYVIIVYS
jgi:hypothetical protein